MMDETLVMVIWIIVSTLVILCLVLWVTRLHQKLRIMAYCYMDMSDWAAKCLEGNLQAARWKEEGRLDLMEDGGEKFLKEAKKWNEERRLDSVTEGSESIYEGHYLDYFIDDDVTGWKKDWREQYCRNFDDMKRNGITLPKELDLDTPFRSWFR
jgi:hypothetical protein